jgi:hypothetical protein
MTFLKQGLFPSSGEGWETPTLLGPLERDDEWEVKTHFFCWPEAL